MPHIHNNNGEHDSTASAFIVRIDTPEPSILLHVHKKLGKLLQFGGHVELSENPWQAILHEITEETGYDPSQLIILQPENMLITLDNAVLHPYPVCINTHNFSDSPDHKHTDISYAFTTTSEPKGVPDNGESTDFRLLTLSELRGLTDDEIIPNVRAIAEYVLISCVPNWIPLEMSTFQSR